MTQQNLATLHSSVKIDFGKTLKQLKQLKKDLTDIKKTSESLGNIKALGAISKQNKAYAQQNKLIREKARLLRKAEMGRVDVGLSDLGSKDKGRLNRRLGTIEQAAQSGDIEKAKRKLEEFNHEKSKSIKITRKANQEARKLAMAQKKEAMAAEKAARANAKLNMAASKQTSILKKLRSAVVGLTASYTAFAGGAFVNQMGQDIQAAEIMFGTIFEERAPEAMAFMREQANRLGLELVGNSKAFAKYAVAAGAAGFELDEVKEQFLGVAEAGVVFGLTMEQQLGMIRAMEQIASKGTVQMEELKLQMGDRMPAALSIAAKAMGMTRKELIKTIEAGELASKDFIPKFTAELRNMAQGGLGAALETPRVAQGQMVTAFQEMTESFFKGGFGDFLKTTFEILRDIFKILKPFAAVAGAVFAALGAALEPFRVILNLIVGLFEDLDEAFGGGLLEAFTEGVKMLGKAIGWVLSIIIAPFKLLLKLLGGFLRMTGIISKTGVKAVESTAAGSKVVSGGREMISNSKALRAGAQMYSKTTSSVRKAGDGSILRYSKGHKTTAYGWGAAAAAAPAVGSYDNVKTKVQTEISLTRKAERNLKAKTTKQVTTNVKE